MASVRPKASIDGVNHGFNVTPCCANRQVYAMPSAVTRSRRSVVFFGDTSQINQAIGRPVERFSTLSELISGGTLQEQHTQKDLA